MLLLFNSQIHNVSLPVLASINVSAVCCVLSERKKLLMMVVCVNVVREVLCCMLWCIRRVMDGDCVSCTFLCRLQLQSPDVPRHLFMRVLKH